MSKQILGLDLGTNSIGWAMVGTDANGQPCEIKQAGSRIIPMDATLMGDFEKGNSISQTHDRTMHRSMRRMYERRTLRRERLCRVLDILGALPEHYSSCLNRYGQLQKGQEPKLAWKDGQFVFMSAFHEMCDEFKAVRPELFANGKTIAYDWTIYYLRKKALSQPITKQELAWILMQFNQKRGYNQARGEEEEEKTTEKKEFYSLLVTEVRPTGEVSKGKEWYEVVLENGWIYRRQSQFPLDWVGKTKEFIVTTKLNADGSDKVDKEGQVMRSFRAPNDDDWGLRKLKTEHDIDQSEQTVGEYIYQALLHQQDQKIIGQLIRTIDRAYYKKELQRIVRKQMEFIPELQNAQLYQECIEALYTSNEAYRVSISQRDFAYLLVDDILFYQRPLKSKKTLIKECPYESYEYKDEDGKKVQKKLKCVPKSHPIYEEFRVRQFVSNLRILRGSADGVNKEDCTEQYITDREILVCQCMVCKTVNQKSMLKMVAGKEAKNLSWNYPDKDYPMAPTTAMLSKAFQASGKQATQEDLLQLWHILYSVLDKTELDKALQSYALSHGLSEDFVNTLSKQKPFASEYGSYSLKATKKLLALMRSGNSWSIDAIDNHTKQRIEHILTGEYDENIPDRIREKCKEKQDIQDFQGLDLWLAEYVVYGVRDHSDKWASPADIDNYLKEFRIHSLNNPIVEQVVMETLRVVRDIWLQFGTIDEIHLEMGRDLKNPADKRKEMAQRAVDNEKNNIRIKRLLMEFAQPDMNIEGVHSYSPSQQELLRIYEGDVLASNDIPDDIQAIINDLSSSQQPSHAEVLKYRLWLEQKYRSPYTGCIIPLSKLFTSAYQIEHIIPQSRYFDDSMRNKVICEAEVNGLKDRQMAHEFILNHGGQKVVLTGGKIVEVLRQAEYEALVKELYKNNPHKLQHLMLDDIPEDFIARQMNDSRYISRLIKGLLSNIVREQNPQTHEYEVEETSKNLIVTNGFVTTRLKKDWGINDVWNHIILPRFERLNSLKGTDIYTTLNTNGQRIPALPLESQRINKKRIDHRHHAMDAIVIACATRNHVNLLSNLSAASTQQENRIALNNLLRERISFGNGRYAYDKFFKPWPTFTQDVEKSLQDIVVSFKQNLRIVNNAINYYTVIENGKKTQKKQEKGTNWAIRKSLHKDTVFGSVNLQQTKPVSLKCALENLSSIVDKDLRKQLRQLVAEGKNEKQIKQYFASEPDMWSDINLQKIEIYYYTGDTSDRYYAVRTAVDESFTADTIAKITDSGIRKILMRHLEENDNDPKLAFSADGIENMNRDIVRLNNGTPHKPIYRVRKYEKADKFAVGTIGAKSSKYVEGAKGTKLYTLIYERLDGKRKLYPLSLQQAIQYQCQFGYKSWINELSKYLISQGEIDSQYCFLYVMSPGNLVYLPTDEELVSRIYSFDTTRIYKVVSLEDENPNFIPASIAAMIVDKEEFTARNKSSRSLDDKLIKDTCIPVQVDRLGNIIRHD